MNQELLKRTLKNRRIKLASQERKDYYPREPLFMFLFTSVALPFCPLMAKIKSETVKPESIQFVVLFPVVLVTVGHIAYRNKKNTLRLHYINTALTPQGQ